MKEEIWKQYPALKQSALKSLSQSFSVINEDTKKELNNYFDNCCQEFLYRHEQAVMVARKDEEL